MRMQGAADAILLLAAMTVVRLGVEDGLVAATNLTDKLSSCLVEKFDNAPVNFSTLQAHYAELYADQEMVEVRLDGLETVLDMAGQLARDFQEIADALRNTTVVIEQAYAGHVGQNCCSLECIGTEFSREKCSRHCPEVKVGGEDSQQLEFYRSQVGEQKLEHSSIFMDLNFKHDALIGRSMNLNESALHYPVDIYDREPHLLCFAQWSQALTLRYADFQNTTTVSANILIVGQYFASSNGSLRFYPASDWSYLNQCQRCPRERVDSYDSRYRPWYMNTIPGAKFLIIVMDLSGSVSGFRLLLAKLMAKELLLSLSQNDFFLVLAVGGKVEKPRPLGWCFTSKTRASPENVLTMIEVIEAILKSSGPIKSYKSVVNRTLKAFQSGPEYHMIFAFLSDRGALISDLAESLEQGGVVDMQVRVFVILTGYARKILNEDKDRLESVACRSGGRFQEIQKYSDIKDFIIKVFTEHVRSLSLNSTGEEVFWNSYRDVYGSYILSCSQPVYTAKEKENKTFVGVGGIDVNLKLLESLFYKYDLGAYGYGFIVDNNGQLLVHPLINHSYIETVSGDDLISLDLGRHEHAQNSSDFEVLRRSLLDRENGSRAMEAWVPVRGQSSEFRLMNVTYHYAPINGTQFSIAIVVPESSVTMVTTQLTSEQIKSFPSNLSLLNTTYYIDPTRSFCNQAASDLLPSSEAKEFMEKLIMKLVDDPNSSIANCDARLYNNLLFDLKASLQLVNKTLEQYGRLGPPRNQPLCRNSTLVLYFPSGLTTCSILPPRLIANHRSCDAFLSPSSLRDAILHQQQNSRDNLFFHKVNGRVVAARFMEWNESSAGMERKIGSPSNVIFVQASASCSSFTSCFKEASDMEDNSSVVILLGQGGGVVLHSSDKEEAAGTFADHYPHVFKHFFTSKMANTTIPGFELRPCPNTFRNMTESRKSDAISDYKGVVLSLLSGIWWVLSGGLLLTLECALISLYMSLATLLVVAKDNPSAGSMDPMACPVYLCEHPVNSLQWPEPPVSTSAEATCNITGRTQQYELTGVPRTNLLVLKLHPQDSNCSDASLLDLHVQCPCSSCAEVGGKMMNGESDTCTPEDGGRDVYRVPLMGAGSGAMHHLDSNATWEWCAGNGASSVSMDTFLVTASLCLMAAVDAKPLTPPSHIIIYIMTSSFIRLLT